MPTISPTSSFINSWIVQELQDTLRSSSCFDIAMPNTNGMQKTGYGTYQLKDMSSHFKREGMKGKTQRIPRMGKLTANTLIHETEPTYQDWSHTYRSISIDPTICAAVKLNDFNDDFHNLPDNDKAAISREISRAIAERIHREAFVLATGATQATKTSDGSNIGGSGTKPTLSLIEQLNSRVFADKHSATEPRFLIMSQEQAQKLALYSGLSLSNYNPYMAMGDKGVKQYETGLIQGNIAGCKILTSDLVMTGSAATTTYNMMIVGQQKIGYAIGKAIPKEESKLDNTTRIQYSLQYGLFILDERAVYKFEMDKY